MTLEAIWTEMYFYLEKRDQKNAWLILAKDGADYDTQVLGWRVDVIEPTAKGSRTLAVFPALSGNTSSQIIGVVKIDLENTSRITVSTVQRLGSDTRGAEDQDLEIKKDLPKDLVDTVTSFSVWSIGMDGSPELPTLDIGTKNQKPVGEDAVDTFLTPIDGNKLYPGGLSDEIARLPVVELRVREHASDDTVRGNQPATYDLTFFMREKPADLKGLEISVEHLLAARDVVPLLENAEHQGVFNSLGSIVLGETEEILRLESETAGGDYVRLGLHDRIVLVSDRDCVFEYWLDETRLKFTAAKGLMVLQHYGEGEMVQDTGAVRQRYGDMINEENKGRETPLFDKIKERPFKLPFNSDDTYGLPLQYACFDLSQSIAELRYTPRTLVPISMRAFAERPSLFFGLLHPKFAELVDIEYDPIEKQVKTEEAILNYCELVLMEAYVTRARETGITTEDIEIWCSSVSPEQGWNLYELVISGAAEEMISNGISFDQTNPMRFAQVYNRRRKTTNSLGETRALPVPLRVTRLKSKFQKLDEAIRALESVEEDWGKVKGIEDELANCGQIFISTPPPKERERTNLFPFEHDKTSEDRSLRRYLTPQVDQLLPDILKRHDPGEVLDRQVVLDVIVSWFIDDHQKDLITVKDALKYLRIPEYRLKDAILAAAEPERFTLDLNSSEFESFSVEKYLRRCVTRLGHDMILAIAGSGGKSSRAAE